MDPAQGRTGVLCKLCNLLFSSDHALHVHKSESSRHIYCKKCGQDFNNPNAYKQHHDLLHSKEQELNCPGCGKRFTRVGGLIGHIELESCKAVRSEDLEWARKEKECINATAAAAHNFQDFSRSGALGAGPNPFAINPGLQSQSRIPQTKVTVPVFEGDNLIGALDSWGPVAESLNESVISSADFPALTAKGPASGGTGPTPVSAWAVKKDLFSSDSPAKSPAPLSSFGVAGNMPRLLKATSPEKKELNEHDPDNPLFNSRKYWIQLIGKFKCPYLGCGKSIEKRNAFIQHLKSPAHRNEKLQCVHCLRYFDTATALTQHMESQGTRCKVREITRYNTVVDEVTGGVIATRGRHEDDTVKYVVNESLLTASGVVQANKAAHEAKAKKMEEYWDKTMPIW